MCKFESSQKYESKAHRLIPQKAYSKPRVLDDEIEPECLFLKGIITSCMQ